MHSTFVSDVELYKESDLRNAVANDRGALSRSTTSVGERERGPITGKILANFLAHGKGVSTVVDENGEMMFLRGASGMVDTSSGYKLNDLKSDRPYLEKKSQATDGALLHSGNAGGSRLDQRSVAAAHSSLEKIANSLRNPDPKVKGMIPVSAKEAFRCVAE